MAIGVAPLQKSGPYTESNIVLGFDFSARHEIVAGQTITAAVCAVTLNGTVNTDLTLGTPAIDLTGKIVSVAVTDTAAVLGRTYKVSCQPTFSGSPNPKLAEGIDVPVRAA